MFIQFKDHRSNRVPMKHYLVSVCLLIASFPSGAQITITQVDLPHSGQSFITTSAVVDFTIDPSQTGANVTWDFQQLTPLTSAADTFYGLSELSFLYQLLYAGANLVDKTPYNIAIDQLMLEDVYLVFESNANELKQYGFAGTIDGIPVPVIYSDKDVIYNFPIEFNGVDSSTSGFALGLTGLGYVSQQRKRVNTVDGWGTVKTPAGIFDALRITSVITDVDSVYLDTLGFGTNVTLKSYEYKWLAQEGGTPVLQINAQDVLGVPVITQITYQDTALQTGLQAATNGTSPSVSVFPNPAGDQLQLHWNNVPMKPAIVTVTDLSGAVVKMIEMKQPVEILHTASWKNGIYFLQVEYDGGIQHITCIVQH